LSLDRAVRWLSDSITDAADNLDGFPASGAMVGAPRPNLERSYGHTPPLDSSGATRQFSVTTSAETRSELMRMRGSQPTLLLATLTLLTVAARPALAAFDIDLEVDPGSAKSVQFQKPAPAREFQTNVAVYLRILPVKSNRALPVFITTKNYLTCPDSEKHWNLNDVKDVASDRRSGVRVLGFFFEKPACEKATFHLEAVVGDG
jgi:hypothetical protein